jgi:hypothetical protein
VKLSAQPGTVLTYKYLVKHGTEKYLVKHGTEVVSWETIPFDRSLKVTNAATVENDAHPDGNICFISCGFHAHITQ